jgi:hypothetical protein
MARNGISPRAQASAVASHDPVPAIDHCVAILAIVLLLSLLGGAAFAAERGTPEQRRACTPDVFKHCGEFIPDADRITACLRQKVSDLSPECRVVMAGERRS